MTARAPRAHGQVTPWPPRSHRRGTAPGTSLCCYRTCSLCRLTPPFEREKNRDGPLDAVDAPSTPSPDDPGTHRPRIVIRSDTDTQHRHRTCAIISQRALSGAPASTRGLPSSLAKGYLECEPFASLPPDSAARPTRRHEQRRGFRNARGVMTLLRTCCRPCRPRRPLCKRHGTPPFVLHTHV